MRNNKKVKNATVCKFDGIWFKSILERTTYRVLLEKGFKPQYEPKTFCLVEKSESTTPFYDKETDIQYKKRRSEGDRSIRKLVKKSNIIQAIKYTPDFYFEYNGVHVYIETKGFENDRFSLIKRLFRKYLDTLPQYSIFFEVYTKSQLLQAIQIIKEYADSIKENKVTYTSIAP